jgi:protein arginine N-methyltransferase 2
MNEENDPLASVDIDLNTQSLLLASANHDLAAIKDLIKTTSATVQDPETGFTPLHAAIAACEEEEPQTNGFHHGDISDSRKQDLEKATEAVRLLLQNGAIWNDLDTNDETPGCIAKRLELNEIYEVIVDAGVRAELLLSKLEEYQLLGDASDASDMEDEVETREVLDANGLEAPSEPVDPSARNEDYLRSNLAIQDSSILDSATNGVMMGWEKPIMACHVNLLLPLPGLRVLNVGHGMGIIDDFFQSHAPAAHHIIEAHPDVIAKMKDRGWLEKPGVVVHEGRWQDVLPALVGGDENGGEILFDAIYFDTFAEDYKALREFFSEYVIQFLDPQGKFSFFNGMGADRQVCYDVYTKVRYVFNNLNIVLTQTSGCRNGSVRSRP